MAGLFGAQAALLFYGVDHDMHMAQALATRDMSGRAKGILMERFGVDGGRAFQMLVRSSQDSNLDSSTSPSSSPPTPGENTVYGRPRPHPDAG